MQYLNIFLGLLSKTSSRDTILRFVQYATLHSVDSGEKGATYNVYIQMRRTRKILRFLRTLEHSSAIRKELTTFSKVLGNNPAMIKKILVILEHLFTLLFYVFDHRVVLGELQVISKDNVVVNYPRSMKMYKWQNIVGALKCLLTLALIIMEGKYEGEVLDMEKGTKLMKKFAVQFIKNILDIFVANYYLNQPAGKASIIGVIGMVTSIIGVAQALNMI